MGVKGGHAGAALSRAHTQCEGVGSWARSLAFVGFHLRLLFLKRACRLKTLASTGLRIKSFCGRFNSA